MLDLEALRKLSESAEVYLVGGTVRDLLRKRKPNDFDFLVRNISFADFEAFLTPYGSLEQVGKSFGVYLFKPAGQKEVFEIAFPRKEVSTGPKHTDFEVSSDPFLALEEDSNRRDFTINALYLPLNKLKADFTFNSDEVLDFHRGLDHLQRRLVVAVGLPQDRIQEDPLRMMRAMVLLARFAFRLEGKLFGAIRGNASKLRTVSAERIREEFLKILRTEKPSRAFRAMKRTNLLREFFPELNACVGVGQNPKYHSYPVFEHLLAACDAACTLSPSLEIRLAALTHDLGKAETRALKEGGEGPDDVTFYNHEVVSVDLLRKFLKRLRFSNDFSQSVLSLVEQHQYKYDRNWTDRAVRKFIRKLNIREEDLQDLNSFPQFIVRQADRMGNEFKADLPVTQKQEDFQERIIKVFQKTTALEKRNLAVNGSDLIEKFSLSSGPKIGKILNALFEQVDQSPELNQKELLLNIATQILQEEESNGG